MIRLENTKVVDEGSLKCVYLKIAVDRWVYLSQERGSLSDAITKAVHLKLDKLFKQYVMESVETIHQAAIDDAVRMMVIVKLRATGLIRKLNAEWNF